MTIKILHIINHLKLGGAQICLKYMVEQFPVEQVKSYTYPLRQGDSNNINADIIRHNRINYSPLKLWDVIKICRKNNIDIIHAHLNKSIILAILASFICKAKIIVHEHGPIVRKGLQFSLYRIILRLFKSRVAQYIAVSDFIKDAMVQKCKIKPDQINVVYNALDLKKFQKNKTCRVTLRKQFNINENDIVLGFSGRLNSIKGADLLPSILQLLHNNGRKYHMIIAGDGSLYSRIQSEAKTLGLSDFIHLLGLRKDMPEVISAFDLAIHPSRQEAFGISVIEYFSVEVPVICSSSEGLIEIAKDHETAITIDKLTPENIADKVIELISNQTLKNQITANAKDFCGQFSVEKQIEQIIKLYKKILSE